MKRINKILEHELCRYIKNRRSHLLLSLPEVQNRTHIPLSRLLDLELEIATMSASEWISLCNAMNTNVNEIRSIVDIFK